MNGKIFRHGLFIMLWAACPVARAGWVVVCEDNSVVSQGLPDDLSGRLRELSARHVRLKSVAFTPARGWVVLYDKCGFASARVPESAVAKLAELAAGGADLQSIAFTPWSDDCGWVILYDKNRSASMGFPPPFRQQIDEVADRGSALKSVAIVRTGSLALLFDKNGSSVEQPTSKKELQGLVAAGAELRSIAFTDWNGWAILHDGGLACSNLPDGAEAALRGLIDRGKAPRSIAFCADPIRLSRDDPATRSRVLRLMEHYKVPGLSIAVVDKGTIAWSRAYGVSTPGGRPITTDTRFQAASLSKPVTAIGVLRLVEQGKLGLDDDLSGYMKGWRIPASRFTETANVTLRQTLSHSAGFTVHGFPGYAQGRPLPGLADILDGRGPANTAPVVVGAPPGREFSYSGGGYCVLQQAVIDVTGKAFEDVMAEQVLVPLGMVHSTYQQPPPAGFEAIAAVGHDKMGRPVAGGWRNYPEMAPAGLWSTPSDVARFVIGIQEAARGGEHAIVRSETAGAFLAKQIATSRPGEGWGLGVALRGDGASLMFSHTGRNAGFDSIMTGSARTGQGAVIMMNANETGGLAAQLIRDLREEYAWPE